MTDIYVVRHGNTFDKGEVVTRVGARTDPALSRSGCAQAEALAEHFSGIVTGGFSKAYCSALVRTRQTAEAILKQYAHAPELEVLDFLREVDYGPDENRPEKEVIARIGVEALSLWESQAVPPPGWKIDPNAIKQQWQVLFHQIATEQADQGPVLIVTSNGIARFALQATAAGSVSIETIKLSTGAFGRFSIDRDGNARLREWNIRPRQSAFD
ncbi:MAG: histidine phosphatase family protein [Henriciella sp.]|nr:histidine phosphatase family protein [Henriciella sp.]